MELFWKCVVLSYISENIDYGFVKKSQEEKKYSVTRATGRPVRGVKEFRGGIAS